MNRFRMMFLVMLGLAVGLALFVACGGGGGGGGGGSIPSGDSGYGGAGAGGDIGGGYTFLLFSGDNGIDGVELWSTDGTDAGTTMVKDIYPGGTPSPNNSWPWNYVSQDGRVYFSANNGTNGNELWSSDGTAAGTTLVKDIYSPNLSSWPGNLASFESRFFFHATDSRGAELWSSDGTAAGTTIVRDIATGSGGSLPKYFTPYGNRLYFSAWDSRGFELWASDGTASGTTLVIDLYPGGAPFPNNSNPQYLAVLNSKLYFSAYSDTSRGRELWSSDGTATGTTLVVDIYPGGVPIPNSSQPRFLTLYKNRLYFSGSDGTRGSELWATDGTAAGTTLIVDINPLAGNSSPQFLTVFDNTLYFAADDGVRGQELWMTDGTAAGTTIVADINPAGGSWMFPLGVINGKLIFAAYDPTRGYELWSTDGSAGGTTVVKELNPGTGDGVPIT